MLKKSLCLAAAALAGSLLSASAQNVYSLNIVGYVNAVVATNGFTLMANPLDDGKGNNLTNLVPSTLPTASSVYVWDKVGVKYITANKKSTGAWSTNLAILPGTGYFIKHTNTIVYTNTYVGALPGPIPGSITNNITAGFNLVGSSYPIASGFTNMGSNTMNFAAGLPTGSTVYTWDSSGNKYVTANKKSTGAWSTNVFVNVGTGFFIKNPSNTTVQWIQNVGP
jgi:hypothetical protein